MNLRSLLVIAAIGTLSLTACGSDDAASPATQAAGDAFNEADVTFAQGMVAHHEQAIEMSEIALDPTIGASEAVRDLANRIKGAQDPEIALMSGWLLAWGQPIQMVLTEGHDMSSMEGVMSASEMDALGATTGAAFDTMWMEMMIRHHAGAIAMAQTVKAASANADVLSLADRIIAAQQGEIEEMNALLGG
ncbi:MAG: DUF305 domain-containing protein [Actinobacteria bacterium]|nr:DUF305 domain-containing protein [Actinomycetota bacterium]